MYFAKSTLGFYDNPSNYPDFPGDSIEIEDALYQQLLDGQAAGKVIGVGTDGQPILSDPPPPSAADLLAAATSQRTGRLSAAALAIAPLQDAADLDIATDAELTLLKAWKQYRVALNRLDLTAPEIEWPAPPAPADEAVEHAAA